MNHQTRFASVPRSLTRIPSRRDILRGLVTAGMGIGALRMPDAATAKKRRNNKKPVRPNTYGCLNVGAVCKNASQCCSGICRGPKGKKRCRTHDASTCAPQQFFCTSGAPVACNLGNSSAVCMRTTGQGAFCGDLSDDKALCRDCTRDADCREELGPGAACVAFNLGICQSLGLCPDTGGMACVASGASSAA
jgi:hypothetical protein